MDLLNLSPSIMLQKSPESRRVRMISGVTGLNGLIHVVHRTSSACISLKLTFLEIPG